MTADRVTRVASDLFDSAAAAGARQSRSAKQQLDYWARVGREVTFCVGLGQHHAGSATAPVARFVADSPSKGRTGHDGRRPA